MVRIIDIFLVLGVLGALLYLFYFKKIMKISQRFGYNLGIFSKMFGKLIISGFQFLLESFEIILLVLMFIVFIMNKGGFVFNNYRAVFFILVILSIIDLLIKVLVDWYGRLKFLIGSMRK